MTESRPDDIAKMTVDLVKDFLASSGQAMAPRDFVQFVAEVRASLEGSNPEGRKPTPDDAERNTEKVAGKDLADQHRGKSRESAAPSEPASPQWRPTDIYGEDEVEPGLARGLLRVSGKTYRKQRNALTEEPAVNPRKSYTDEYIICLEDGERVKFLRRHLSSYYGMSVDEYLAKWNLPKDYPTVPKKYVERRRKLVEESRGADGMFGRSKSSG